MLFVETSIFTASITKTLSDEEYRHLQLSLLLRPDAGAIMKASGGIRKVRWGAGTSGKRGGVRIIYYWDSGDAIYMLYAYKKGKQEDLSPKQLSQLRTYVEDYLK
ncbi:MAG: type II toxin-antitoxin system RelE/ParE family toxin [Verrucomicrobiota bacterium]